MNISDQINYTRPEKVGPYMNRSTSDLQMCGCQACHIL